MIIDDSHNYPKPRRGDMIIDDSHFMVKTKHVTPIGVLEIWCDALL
jgi:hypothetical protein